MNTVTRGDEGPAILAPAGPTDPRALRQWTPRRNHGHQDPVRASNAAAFRSISPGIGHRNGILYTMIPRTRPLPPAHHRTAAARRPATQVVGDQRRPARALVESS